MFILGDLEFENSKCSSVFSIYFSTTYLKDTSSFLRPACTMTSARSFINITLYSTDILCIYNRPKFKPSE